MVDFVFYENCKICDTKGKKIYSENYSDKNFVNFFSNFYGHINYNLLLEEQDKAKKYASKAKEIYKANNNKSGLLRADDMLKISIEED